MTDPISQRNAVKELLAWGDWAQHQRDRQDEYDDFVRTLTPEQLKLHLKIRQQDLADAQKHGEQIGWYRGMTEAANIISNDRKALKSLSDVQAILAARDNKKEI